MKWVQKQTEPVCSVSRITVIKKNKAYVSKIHVIYSKYNYFFVLPMESLFKKFGTTKLKNGVALFLSISIYRISN